MIEKLLHEPESRDLKVAHAKVIHGKINELIDTVNRLVERPSSWYCEKCGWGNGGTVWKCSRCDYRYSGRRIND